MKLYPILASAVAGMLLCGCTITPTINHRALSEGGPNDGWIPYQLTDTTLVIGTSIQVPPQITSSDGKSDSDKSDKKDPSAAAKNETADHPDSSKIVGPKPSGQAALLQPVGHSELYPVKLEGTTVTCSGSYCDTLVAMTAIPVPFEELTLGIEPVDHDFVQTLAAATYFPNSLRLRTLEVSIHDQRQETLDTVGAIVTGARQLASSSKSSDKVPLRLPIVIDLSEARQTLGGSYLPLPLNEGTWWYKIKFFDDPTKSGFLSRSDYAQVHKAVLTSLCRRMDLILTDRDPSQFAPSADGTLAAGESKLELGVTVADPTYLLAIPLPVSGTIAFGDLCGADVKMNTAVTTPANVLATDFFAQVNALRKPVVTTPAVPTKIIDETVNKTVNKTVTKK